MLRQEKWWEVNIDHWVSYMNVRTNICTVCNKAVSEDYTISKEYVTKKNKE